MKITILLAILLLVIGCEPSNRQKRHKHIPKFKKGDTLIVKTTGEIIYIAQTCVIAHYPNYDSEECRYIVRLSGKKYLDEFDRLIDIYMYESELAHKPEPPLQESKGE